MKNTEKHNEKLHCIMCNSTRIEKFDARPCEFVRFKMFNNKEMDNEYLYHCKDCNMYWSSFRPNEEEVNAYYHDYVTEEFIKLRCSFEPHYKGLIDQNQNRFKDIDVPKTRRDSIWNAISEHVDATEIKSVLDYGGGNGELIPEEFTNAQKYVYEVIEGLKPYKDVKFISEKELASHKFDYIQSCQTLEHVSDPKSVINAMLELLNDNGILYIEVPFDDTWMEVPLENNKKLIYIHEHINFFKTDVFAKFFNYKKYKIFTNRVFKIDSYYSISTKDKKENLVCIIKKTKPSNLNILFNKIYMTKIKFLSSLENLENKIRKITILYLMLKG